MSAILLDVDGRREKGVRGHRPQDKYLAAQGKGQTRSPQSIVYRGAPAKAGIQTRGDDHGQRSGDGDGWREEAIPSLVAGNVVAYRSIVCRILFTVCCDGLSFLVCLRGVRYG
jgi:hypothetical protein